jgi:hypothetical protein
LLGERALILDMTEPVSLLRREPVWGIVVRAGRWSWDVAMGAFFASAMAV